MPPSSNNRRISTPSKLSAGAKSQSHSVKRNNTLLNFFQKADGPPKSTTKQARITQFTTQGERPGSRVTAPRPRLLKREGSSNASGGGDEGLFLEDKKSRDARLSQEQIERERSRSPDIWGSRSGDEENEDAGAARSLEEGMEEGTDRYNERENAVKRRKIDLEAPHARSAERKVSSKAQISGPFIDESDSENEGLEAFRDYADGEADVSPDKYVKESEAHSDEDQTARKRDLAADISPLVREATSHMQEDECPDFDDIEAGGLEDEGLDFECEAAVGEETFGFDANDTTADTIHADEKPTCPVCQGSLEGFDEMVCSLVQAF